MPTIFDALKRDHRKVKDELRKICATTSRAAKTREKLFHQIKSELEVHTRFEEEVFYPAVRKVPGLSSNVGDALHEHDEAKSMLGALSRMDKTSDEFLEKLQKLQQALDHHIKDEEQEMFPKAREGIARDEAERMAADYRSVKQQELRKAAA
jgi:iron-sulfur cluster repair protein YtfE (RIC family)